MALPWKSYRFLFKKLSKTQHVSGVFVDVEVNVDGDLHIDLDDDVDDDVYVVDGTVDGKDNKEEKTREVSDIGCIT